MKSTSTTRLIKTISIRISLHKVLYQFDFIPFSLSPFETEHPDPHRADYEQPFTGEIFNTEKISGPVFEISGPVFKPLATRKVSGPILKPP